MNKKTEVESLETSLEYAKAMLNDAWKRIAMAGYENAVAEARVIYIDPRATSREISIRMAEWNLTRAAKMVAEDNLRACDAHHTLVCQKEAAAAEFPRPFSVVAAEAKS